MDTSTWISKYEPGNIVRLNDDFPDHVKLELSILAKEDLGRRFKLFAKRNEQGLKLEQLYSRGNVILHRFFRIEEKYFHRELQGDASYINHQWIFRLRFRLPLNLINHQWIFSRLSMLDIQPSEQPSQQSSQLATLNTYTNVYKEHESRNMSLPKETGKLIRKTGNQYHVQMPSSTLELTYSGEPGGSPGSIISTYKSSGSAKISQNEAFKES